VKVDDKEMLGHYRLGFGETAGGQGQLWGRSGLQLGQSMVLAEELAGIEIETPRLVGGTAGGMGCS